MTARDDIARAASAVDGISAHPYYVQATQAGTAYLQLDRIEYPNPFGGVCFWNLVVLLPQDLASAEKYIELNVPLVVEAISQHMVVTSVRPQQLNTGAGVLPCVFISGHREE